MTSATDRRAALERERACLIQEIERIDSKRAELKARIVAENRRRGVSKHRVADLIAERAALLQERGEVRAQLVAINKLRRESNRQQAGQVFTVAQHFQAVCRESLPREMYEELLGIAQERAERKGVGA